MSEKEARAQGPEAAGHLPRLRGRRLRPATRWASARSSRCPKLLEQAGKNVADIDLWELNEAFAVQVHLLPRHARHPERPLNVNGGAIALGHPYGMTRRAAGRPRAHRGQAPRREARGGDDVHRRRHGRGGPVRSGLKKS